jgi:hypothetical protein
MSEAKSVITPKPSMERTSLALLATSLRSPRDSAHLAPRSAAFIIWAACL